MYRYYTISRADFQMKEKNFKGRRRRPGRFRGSTDRRRGQVYAEIGKRYACDIENRLQWIINRIAWYNIKN